jgi:hypothetical protein
MEYCLCIKPNDKNLLHIVTRRDLRKAHFYASYRVVATAADEIEAFAAAASLVQEYCDAHGSDDFSNFGRWAKGVRL